MDFVEKFIEFIMAMVAKIKELVATIQGAVKDETTTAAPTEVPTDEPA